MAVGYYSQQSLELPEGLRAIDAVVAARTLKARRDALPVRQVRIRGARTGPPPS